MAGFKTAFRYGGTVNYRWPNAGTAVGKAGKAAKLPAPDSCSPPVARKASSSSDHDDETLPRWRAILRWVWRYGLPPALLMLGLAAGFLVPYLIVLDGHVREEFGRLTWQEPTRVLARPLELAPGLPMTTAALDAELAAARFIEDGQARQPGSFRRDGDYYLIATRGFADIDGRIAPAKVEVELKGGRVRTLLSNGQPAQSVRLDPARIATLYGEKQEDRRLVRLEDVPTLFLTTLQAVEDRDFKRHFGIDLKGIVRAAWVNLRSGEVKQGASTLTQQLVRNLYLTRKQRIGRKFKEILYALVIEARFSKRAILEAYVNQVYLGQQGGQAVHGVAAAADFWFGRDLDQLSSSDIALLVGMIKGPSLYDPRRKPEAALTRRNIVLQQMHDVGLLDEARFRAARGTPLGVARRANLSQNRYPAFMALVRDQLLRDYPADALRGAGLAILTTLVPSAQEGAEQAMKKSLAELGRKDRPELQGALVLTDTKRGDVLAVVGARDANDHGFNRALDARRPVGSLLKPFVYLLALAQPDRFALATKVDDAPITVPLPGRKTWSPDNVDGRSHGRVSLLEALTRSYNQATVRIGLDVGVERLARLLKVLAAIDATPNPALLLGAVDLSPLQLTQAYQFIASGGQVQPLHAVRAVLNRDGQPMQRYDAEPAPAQHGDTIAARLVALALQETVRTGTAARLNAEGLGWMQPAGKTGTSNDSRDSWFAGFTGSHLAVVWVGNDRNEPTGLYGSTGAMKVWGELFRRLPNEPLKVPMEGLDTVFVDDEELVLTDEACPGAKPFVFVQGYAPREYRGCPMTKFRQWLGPDQEEESQ